jgi:signal peptidase I
MILSLLPQMMLLSLGVLAGLIVSSLVLLRSLFLFITIEGASMSPTLESRDRVLVLRTWAARRLKKGSIVLLKNPASSSPEDTIIKRIVAMEGDIYTASLSVVPASSPDDQPVPDDAGRRSWHIPLGQVFVCGDHLAASRDSREWGPIPLSFIQGVLVHQFKRKEQVSVPKSHYSLSFLTVGQQAPDFSLVDLCGKCFTLHDIRGQRLLLLFTAYHQLARQILPTLLTQTADVESQGIMILLICDESLERAHLMQEELHIPFPVLVEPKGHSSIYKDYQITGTPCYYLIDEQGRVAGAGIANAFSKRWACEAASRNIAFLL